MPITQYPPVQDKTTYVDEGQSVSKATVTDPDTQETLLAILRQLKKITLHLQILNNEEI